MALRASLRAFSHGGGLSRGSLAIVRGVPESFTQSLCMEKPAEPIDVDRARQQHAAYVAALRGLVQEVVELPPDERFPDCPFVEDSAVVIGEKAIVTRMGAETRRGEEVAVEEALRNLGLKVTTMKEPACLDGGDVLHVAEHLFVGVGRRTNAEGVAALQSAFPEVPVVAVPIPDGPGLHLKSVISWAGGKTLPVEASHQGREVFRAIQRRVPSLESFEVPELGSALSLFVGGKLLCPSAYPMAFKKYVQQFPSSCMGVDLSEFHKADGGMTCLSLNIE